MVRPYAMPTAAAAAVFTLLVTACSGITGGRGEDAALEVWIMGGTDPGADAYFDDVAAEFEEQAGTQVEVRFVPWSVAHDTLATAIAEERTPDVAEISTTWTQEFAGSGALTDITGRVADTGAYAQSLVEAGTVEDRLYGLPWYAGVRAIVYRADVFEELGLEEPGTWAELRDAATAIAAEKPDMTAFPVPGGAEYSLLPFIWGAGAKIAEQNEDGTWISGIDSDEARKGISFYTGLALEDGVSSTGSAMWEGTTVQGGLAEGTIAMAISGSWTPEAILEENPELEGKISSFPIPGPDGGYSPSFLGGSHLSVFDDTEDENLAWFYIRTLTNDGFADRWREQTTYFSGKHEQIIPHTESDDPLVRPFAVQMHEAGKGTPSTVDYARVQGEEVLQTMVQSVLNGDSSVEEASAVAADDIERLLNGDA